MKMDGRVMTLKTTQHRPAHWVGSGKSRLGRGEDRDVNCIVFNEEFMECTWNLEEQRTNSTLYYWYASHTPQECRNYIQHDGYNVGCNFSASEIIHFKAFKVFRNGSSDSKNITREPQIFYLQDQVKPYPPGNLMVNTTESNGVLLTWEAPMTARCLEYIVKYQINKDKKWQKSAISIQTRFNLASVDPKNLYIFQVKTKINMYCGSSNLWSEWSLPVHWGKSKTG
ncbi:cytokine receptor common subunit gamma-like isoform X2 [Narcine bancroftii]